MIRTTSHGWRWPQMALLLAALTIPAPLAAQVHDFWPLVNEAEYAVWGTLTEIDGSDEDRLLVIDVTEAADGRDTRGPAPLRILERAGRLPEGISLRPGATGLFLCHSRGDVTEEFPLVDGWLVSGGFAPFPMEPRIVATLERLFETREDCTQTDPGDLLDLLADPEPLCRALAISWLRHNPVRLDPGQEPRVAALFGVEKHPQLQHAFLELFILWERPLAGERVVNMLLLSRDGGLEDASLRYLTAHASRASQARLLLEFRDASPRQRVLLLEAYARLGLEEAAPFWEEALLSGRADEVRAGLAGMAAAELPGCAKTYETLLTSRSAKVRKLALRGLATLCTPEAGEIIREYIDQAEEDDPVVRFAKRVLKHPHRYGQPGHRLERERTKSAGR